MLSSFLFRRMLRDGGWEEFSTPLPYNIVGQQTPIALVSLRPLFRNNMASPGGDKSLNAVGMETMTLDELCMRYLTIEEVNYIQ